jgi:adenylate kinase
MNFKNREHKRLNINTKNTNPMLNIVLFGPPGAGKGTQSEKLIAKYNLIHLSTGDLLRSEIAAGTQLGLEAQMLMNAGVLVPDEVVIGMISSKLDKNPTAKGFIFDGFPRTEAQAEALDRLLFEKHTSITMMLALEVSDSELTKRLLMRGMESGRPDDQNEGVIRNRIQEYNNKTAPLKEYYRAQNKFRSVNGLGTIDQIFTALCTVIDPRSNKSVIDSRPIEKSSPAKKEEKTVVKKETPKKEVKAAAKAPAKAAPKKAAKKLVKKAAAKKKSAPKKVAPKKKVVKKAVKKTAPKKVVKKAAKKIVKKSAPKKVVKKVIKKAAKKATPKKVVKKAAKKVSKKTAPKKAVKKSVKKAAPKKKKR